MPDPLEAEPQTLRVQVDVSGLPTVMALARAARDVIDNAEPGQDGAAWPLVRPADLRALEDATAPIYPGTVRDVMPGA